MKNLFSILLLLLFSLGVSAQITHHSGVILGTTGDPIDSAVIVGGNLVFYSGGNSYSTGTGGEGDSASYTYKIIPQSSAPTPDEGLLWYDIDDHILRIYDGTQWDTCNVVGTTGGSGSVTSVAAGDGMDFTTITTTGSVTMGTPTAVTSSSTNNVTTTSHTHALEGTAWGILYMDGSGSATELALGTDGQVLTSTGASTVPAFEDVPGGSSDSLRWFNVVDFGASPTDGSSDVVAIQAALDAADDYYYGGVVYIPPGYWNIDDSIQLRRRVHVYADEFANFLVPSGYTKSVWFNGDYALEWSSVKGGYYDEKTPYEYNWSAIKLKTNSSSYYTVFSNFRDMTVRHAKAAVEVVLTGGAFVTSSLFERIIPHHTKYGLKVVADRNTNNWFDDNKIFNWDIQYGDSTYCGIDLESGRGNNISNNTFWDCADSEISGYEVFNLGSQSLYNIIANNTISPDDDNWDDSGTDNHIWGLDAMTNIIRGGLSLDEDNSARRDSANKIVIANNSNGGTAPTGSHPAYIKFKTYTVGEDPPFLGADYAARIGSKNFAVSNYGADLVFEVSKIGSDDDEATGYLQALRLLYTGDAYFYRGVQIGRASSVPDSTGMIFYDTDDNLFKGRDNDSWVEFGTGGGSPDSASVTYTFTPAATASLTEGGIRYDSDDDKWKGNDGTGTEYVFNPNPVDADTVFHLLADTLFIVGNIGLNNPGDTASMLTTAQFEWPTVQDSVVFDSVYAYCYGTSGSVGVRVYEKDDPTDGTRTYIHAEITPTTGTPAGTSTFTQEASGPGKILGFALTTVTTEPTQVVCIIFYHEKRAY